MKKYRKQKVYVFGRKRLVDVPVDKKLYKADNRAEYQRARSKKKDISLDELIIADVTIDVSEAYEEKQLLECLQIAVRSLNENERQIIECIYYDGLTEKETAATLMIAQQTVNKKKHKAIKKLRKILIDWL